MISGALIASGGLGLGVWQAIDCAKIRFGYVADYDFAIALFLGGWICLLGMLLLIYWRTRSIGIALVAAGVLSYAVFLGSISILKKLDRVAWQHEPPMERIPDAHDNASLVIYFRKGTSRAAINDFIDTVLERAAEPRHQGRDTPEFVAEYYSLSPDQSNGYDGYAMNFTESTSLPETTAYIASIEADPRVERVFFNSVPKSIRLTPEPLVAAPALHKDQHIP